MSIFDVIMVLLAGILLGATVATKHWSDLRNAEADANWDRYGIRAATQRHAPGPGSQAAAHRHP